ncbi:hypothetical protein Mzhil_0341 [Methanosalsum zhilinae DSM 4017]|uniref:Uncharacterized protein n=1 Tax=Methanosalsum zhilinae (strain DSM 4017 / NBRC 107636 / OCM 62 / WeN5) TaxID=679901 RepID=F7XP22_METZD|nr:hypothetical protein Mzhil_0341 [Methanosalsum zhilinae DSM 4017]
MKEQLKFEPDSTDSLAIYLYIFGILLIVILYLSGVLG